MGAARGAGLARRPKGWSPETTPQGHLNMSVRVLGRKGGVAGLGL